MKAALLKEPGKPLIIEDLPTPDPLDNEILIRVKACEVARSVVERLKGKTAMGMKLPIIMGSGGSGVVEKVGKGVRDFKLGDRVCLYSIQSCGNCYNCSLERPDLCSNQKFMGYHFDGTFAEYMRVPEANAFRIPPSISYEEGAIFGSSYGTSFHALKKVGIKKNDLLVICGLGALGLTALQVAKSFGAYVVGIDVSESKLKVAKNVGIDQAWSASDDLPLKVKTLSGNKQGADFVYIAIGNSKVMEQAITYTRRGGKVVVIADSQDPIRVPPISLIMGVELMGSTYFLKTELEDMIKLVTGGKVNLKPLINQSFSLDRIMDAISLLDEKGDQLYRVIAKP